ncbi:MAG: hypothetical protein U1C71_03465 [archaeon]|nr:hypothetical protein [archaeon]
MFGLQEDLPKLAAFLDPSNRIRRARLARTGSAGFAFGGKLFGKVIARAISTENLKAWVAAEKAGIPVEPLIWKNGKLRAHRIRRNRLDRFVSEGDILVYSRVIEGPTLIDFLGGPSGRKWRNEVLRQMGSIEKSFIRRRIIHGHLHYRNMIVTWAEKDGKKWPKVVVIDFDQARVEE